MQVGFEFDLQSARIVWFKRERKLRRTQSRNQSKLFVNSYEDPNVDDMKPSSNNRDGSEDSGACSTSTVLD